MMAPGIASSQMAQLKQQQLIAQRLQQQLQSLSGGDKQNPIESRQNPMESLITATENLILGSTHNGGNSAGSRSAFPGSLHAPRFTGNHVVPPLATGGMMHMPGSGPVGVPGSGPVGVPGSGPVGVPGSGLVGVPGSGPVDVAGSGLVGVAGSGLVGVPGSGPVGVPGPGPVRMPAPGIGSPQDVLAQLQQQQHQQLTGGSSVRMMAPGMGSAQVAQLKQQQLIAQQLLQRLQSLSGGGRHNPMASRITATENLRLGSSPHNGGSSTGSRPVFPGSLHVPRFTGDYAIPPLSTGGIMAMPGPVGSMLGPGVGSPQDMYSQLQQPRQLTCGSSMHMLPSGIGPQDPFSQLQLQQRQELMAQQLRQRRLSLTGAGRKGPSDRKTGFNSAFRGYSHVPRFTAPGATGNRYSGGRQANYSTRAAGNGLSNPFTRRPGGFQPRHFFGRQWPRYTKPKRFFNKRNGPRCVECDTWLGSTKPYIQCPQVRSHKYCFPCCKQSIMRQMSDEAHCPSGQYCRNNRKGRGPPWIFNALEIALVFDDGRDDVITVPTEF